jgi:hypothetical protein
MIFKRTCNDLCKGALSERDKLCEQLSVVHNRSMAVNARTQAQASACPMAQYTRHVMLLCKHDALEIPIIDHAKINTKNG